MKRSLLLKNNSVNLILSDSLLKKFRTTSFDVLSVPGARPKDLWDFMPPPDKFEKIVLFIGGNALENFVSKSGSFRSAEEPSQVAIEICDIAQALISRTKKVFVVGVPPRGTSELQSKVLQLNAELNSLCGQRCSNIIFVGVSHYLYDLKHISKDLCHLESKAFAKVHKLLNEKVLKRKHSKDPNKKVTSTTKESWRYPF